LDFLEKQRLVRRITSGTLYGQLSYQYESYPVVIRDPSLDLLTEADYVYSSATKDLRDNHNLFTLEESYKILEEDGRWTQNMEGEMAGVAADLKTLHENLDAAKFNKVEQKAIRATIDKGKKRHNELYSIKNQLYSSTLEYVAERSRRRWLIGRISTVTPSYLLENIHFKDQLVVYFFNESDIAESAIRELSRADPWRLYWTTSKDTGTPLFRHSATEITDLQYILVLWSKIYDFAYNSPNRPDDKTINDDTLFDSWYQKEIKRLEAEQKRSEIDQKFGGGTGKQEMFIPADPEGAKEVYELNDPTSRMIVKERQKFIDKKGEVPEAQLPDVQREIQMQLNQLRSR
jgi:hypothetical protein